MDGVPFEYNLNGVGVDSACFGGFAVRVYVVPLRAVFFAVK